MSANAEAVSLADRIQARVESGEFQLPPLPELALRLQEKLADEDTDTRAIAALIRTEPALAASLLRTANSALFGGLRPITDLNQAIARLGLRRVGALVTTMLVKGQFQATSEFGTKMQHVLWDHAVTSAAASRELAQREGLDPEEAFLGGLLHGIGRLMVLKGLDEVLTEHPELQVTRPVMDELIEIMQYPLGYRTLKSWNLSEAICDAAKSLDPDFDDDTNTMVNVVRAADAIARKMGNHPQPDPEMNLLDQPPIEVLELRDVELAALMIDLEDAIETFRNLV